MKDVAVIGGGISGLATAYRLRRRGLDVVVLERQARPGGNAISEFLGGFLMEHGPSAVAANEPAALAISRELGLDDVRCDLGPNIRRRYLVKNGRLSGIPLGPCGFLLSNYISPLGRLRILAEAAVPRKIGGTDESVADFSRRRFGAEFSNQVMDPLVAGVYAGRADTASAVSLFPKLVHFEQDRGSVTQGVLDAVFRGGRMPGSRMFSWQDGIGTLPMALAGELGADIQTGVTVRRIDHLNGFYGIDGGEAGFVSARSVVVATPPHVAAQVLNQLNSDLASALSEVAAPPLAVLFLGYRRKDIDHPLDGLGYLCASNQGRSVNGVQFSSTMFPGRAPDDHVSFAVYFGGGRNPPIGLLPERDLIGLAHREMADLLGARAQPVLARARHWPRGIPQYHVGHAKIISRIKSSMQNTRGLFLVGNYLKGPSVAACLSLADDIAVDVERYLSEQVLRNVATTQHQIRASG